MSVQKSRSNTTEKRRRAILKAALDCFTGAGFHSTTMEEIRLRSKASTGSIYHHFTSKEQLAGELYIEGLSDYQEGLLGEIKRHRKAEHGIRAIVDYHLDWVSRNPDWARYLFYMRHAEFVSATEGILKEMNRKFFREFSAWMRPFIERGEIEQLPGDLYASILIGPSQEFARFWLGGRVKSEIALARKVLAEVAWRSLQPKR